jgi:hypothetical protein
MSRFLVLAALLLGACSQAYGTDHRTSAPMVVAGGAPTAADSSPYGVEILGEDGRPLATFEKDGRYYVLGDSGDRYLIHVTNPTDHRVEVVASVDGLDVIDGEAGDLGKRGYVVNPGGDLDIEGFRTSTEEVATFRFSSVGDSYAGRKGAARNVGVIAVALFEEAPAQQIILPDDPPPPPPNYEVYDENSVRGYDGDGGGAKDKKEVPYQPTVTTDTAGGGGDDRVAPASGSGASGGYVGEGEVMRPDYRQPPPPDDEVDQPPPPPDTRDHRGCDDGCNRPGLGTEYGEQRYSAATWTRFVRASDTPTAVAELRYNNAAGLQALGIQCGAPVDEAEITKRETADPFPGDPHFSQQP